MPEKKKQHYVPKFYLKLFSIDNNKKQIGIYNLDQSLIIDKGDLTNQAKEDYFYGKESGVEDELSTLENHASKVINSIIQNQQLPKERSDEYLILLIFIIFLSTRTKSEASLANESLNKTLKEAFKHDSKIKNEIDNSDFIVENSILMILKIVTENVHLAFDLKFKILNNKTDCKFITSDNPVVSYNQFLEKRKHPGCLTGVAVKGIQFFLPINSSIMLLLYDTWVYKIGNRKQKIIDIYDKKEIDQLNLLQFLNCNENIFFNHEISKQYILEVHEKSTKFDNVKMVNVNEFELPKTDDGENQFLIHSFVSDIKIKLAIKDIQETTQAKSFRMTDKAVYLRKE